jgi:hypothetical protein
MARCKQIFDQGLAQLNTKLRPETKATMDALIKVQGMDGQRELIEDMLAIYKQAKPAAAAKAQELVKLLGAN